MFSHCLIQLLLICALSAGQETTLLDKCCPKAKVDGVQYMLIYPNNTNGLANACESSCPYLLDGAEDSLEAKCFNTVVNKDICVFPRPLKRNQQKKAIFMDEVQPKKKRRGGPTMMCGWVFQHSWYRGFSGYTRESQPGMSGNFNRHFQDQVSSVKVENGCEMHLFRDFDLKGPSVTYSRNTPWVGWFWNDKFSSFMCTCKHNELSESTINTKCNKVKQGDTCKLYQLSDLSWNTAEELHTRARKYRRRNAGPIKRWEGGLIEEDTYKVGYIKAAVEKPKDPNCVCCSVTYLTKLGLFHINSAKDAKPIESIDFNTFGAEASAKSSCTYAGVKAKLVLAGGSVSMFDLQLGIGVSSDIGYDLDTYTAEVKLLGVGISLGGETGICALDNCFKINFKRWLG